MKKAPAFIILSICCLSLSAPARAGEREETVHATLFRSPIEVDGTWVGFWDEDNYRRDPLAYNGTVYIPLRTAGDWMGAEVGWEQMRNTVTFTCGQKPIVYAETYGEIGTGEFEAVMTQAAREQNQLEIVNGVSAQLRPDISVEVDGTVFSFANAAGEAVCPLLYDQCVYLPVRSIGALCGKDVLWLSWGSSSADSRIFVYDRPDATQLETARVFCDLAHQYAKELRDSVEVLAEMSGLTDETFHTQMEALRASAQRIIDLPVPSSKMLSSGIAGGRGCAAEIITNINYYLYPDRYLRPSYAAEGWQVWRDVFVSVMRDSCLDNLDRRLAYASLVVDHVRMG